MASLTFKNIWKTYNNNEPAVKDFNLEIRDKEFVVLVGPSGCGKSTTLRMIAGLEEITEGELRIGEKIVNDVAPKDRDIAMVFQNYALYPHMTVYENMAFALKLRHFSKPEIEKRVQKAACILGIEGYLKRKPKQLSGGQRQRVAIGRAIVREPKVFLMDEPLSNLDAKLRNQMRAELIKLHKDLDTTFVYVTHDQIEAMTLGTRIVVMKDGLIQQVATPHEIFEKPFNLFVAGFIGSPQMNFFQDAKLELQDDQYMASMFGQSYRVSKDKEKILKEKSIKPCDVIAGIRPEDMEVTVDHDSIDAKIDVSELMGSEVYLHVNIPNTPGGVEGDCLQTVAVLRIKSYAVPSGMENITIRPLADKIHLFNKDTGVNLLYDQAAE